MRISWRVTYSTVGTAGPGSLTAPVVAHDAVAAAIESVSAPFDANDAKRKTVRTMLWRDAHDPPGRLGQGRDAYHWNRCAEIQAGDRTWPITDGSVIQWRT